jgi:hypothetical protein
MISKALPAVLLFALLLATPAAGAVNSAAAQGPTLMSVEPPSQSVHVGSRITVDITTSNVSNLGAFEFIMHFNPAVLAYVGVQEGPFLGSGGHSVFCAPPITEQDSVRLGCLAFIAVDQPGIDGSGLLGTVTFDAIGAGRSPLTFAAGTSLSIPPVSREAIPSIPFDVEEGVVLVVASSEPVPTTPEPTPTRNPVALTPTPIGNAPTPEPGFTLPEPEPGAPTAAPGSGVATPAPGAITSTTEPHASTSPSAGSGAGTTVSPSGSPSAFEATGGVTDATGAPGAGGQASPSSSSAPESAESVAGRLAIAGEGAPPRSAPIWPTVAGAVLALAGVALLLGGTVGLRRLSEQRQVDHRR